MLRVRKFLEIRTKGGNCHKLTGTDKTILITDSKAFGSRNTKLYLQKGHDEWNMQKRAGEEERELKIQKHEK